ncbi:glutathione S-transferase T3-like [Panicum virgatum]|nr:glutathione S-transferase T3-like [Panicum virgatum]
MPQTSHMFPHTYPVSYPNASNLPENLHFVGASSRGTPSPNASGLAMGTADAQNGSQEETIDIDVDDTLEPTRTDKRLNWSHEEDIRLVSAWLQNSLDPVDGNGKKSDQYWADVTNMYNSTTTSNRRRNRNQLKIRWDRIKKPVSEFHSCWIMTNRVYQSGMSDDQRTDKALQMYASEHDDKPFLLQHIWRVVKNERKWAAYVKRIDKEKSPVSNPAHADNVEDSPKKRPIGTKQAKAVRDGKRKPEVISAIGEKLDKFIDVSNKAKKMAEVQQSLANKKLEVDQLNHKAAQEQTRGKMVDLYRDLFCASTSDMSEEAKAERYKALECMKLALFTIEN